MQLQNFSDIPQELLYPCVAGTLDLTNKAALRIFLCSGVQLTCKALHAKAEECARLVFLNIYPALDSASRTFRCNWIVGRPEVSYFLEIVEKMPLEEVLEIAKNTIFTLNYCSLLHSDFLSYVDSNQTLSFIDLKDSPIFSSTI